MKTTALLSIKTMSYEDILNKDIFTRKFTIIKCSKGQLNILKEDQPYVFKKNSHFFVFENTHLKVLTASRGAYIQMIEIEDEVITDLITYLDHRILSSLDYSNPEYFNDTDNYMLDSLYSQLVFMHNNSDTNLHKKVIQNTLSNYCYLMSEHIMKTKEKNPDFISIFESTLIHKFFIALQDNLYKNRTVSFYAAELNISERHLYHIVNRSLGSTPKQEIDLALISTIKRLLLTTDLSIQQISDKLNFPSQSNFNQFFKRLTHLSPSEFRKG